MFLISPTLFEAFRILPCYQDVIALVIVTINRIIAIAVYSGPHFSSSTSIKSPSESYLRINVRSSGLNVPNRKHAHISPIHQTSVKSQIPMNVSIEEKRMPIG